MVSASWSAEGSAVCVCVCVHAHCVFNSKHHNFMVFLFLLHYYHSYYVHQFKPFTLSESTRFKYKCICTQYLKHILYKYM